MYLDKFDKPGYPILPYVAISSHRMRVNRNRPRVLNTAHFDLLQRHLHMWVRTAGGRFCRIHPRCAAAQIRPKELKCLQEQLLGMFVIKVILVICWF